MPKAYTDSRPESRFQGLPYVEHVGKPILLNKAGHGLARAPIIEQWKSDFHFLGVTIRGKVEFPVGIEAEVWQPTAVLADAMGHAYVVKACIDGLVSCRVLPEDDGQWVRWTRTWAPQIDRSLPRGLVRCRLTVAPQQGTN